MANVRDRLQGRNNPLRRKLQQLGNYNMTHRHGEPIGKYNASHVAGHLVSPDPGSPTRGGQVPATRDHALDPTQAGWNRHNAPKGPVPGWVLAAMQSHIPQGVTPTKPTQAIQGSDAITGLPPAMSYPAGPDSGRPVLGPDGKPMRGQPGFDPGYRHPGQARPPHPRRRRAGVSYTGA